MSFLQKKYASLPPNLVHTYRKPIVLAAGAAFVASPFLAYAHACYQEWLALGRGGVPHNVLGWLVQSSMHVLARSDTREPVPLSYKSLADLAALYGSAGSRSFLAAWVRDRGRAGARPDVPSFVAPQRQTSDAAARGTVERQNAFLEALAETNSALFEFRTSKLEGPLHMALWLRMPSSSFDSGDVNAADRKAKAREVQTRLGRGPAGEFAHVHGEGSTHVTLSPADAASLIARGWAERHRMSGVGGAVGLEMVPWGYVLVYAPRDEAEFEVWREVVLAGARYVAEGAGVDVVVPA
ncbi:hypothetical protein F4677DRAFT_135812 [Hypoxylon crocopeplum]|nr:hypothetical protein F4677DRAFT_135812 [Hypoxylon crocopeplum]